MEKELRKRIEELENLLRELNTINVLACGYGAGAWSVNGKLQERIDAILENHGH